MVKFADGGNKKKLPYSTLQWLGREQDVSSFLNYYYYTIVILLMSFTLVSTIFRIVS